ncbi:unnamed protein product [Microthlaspi erraticum]|uniref:PUM-HD domain-containing protein n=1 Tax=Microthlaspi erraticum TaxID=1685480 RepID=A0A6D2I9B9_9BRAS|nr:unnamed protein product [Microthlaspi erraticum]
MGFGDNNIEGASSSTHFGSDGFLQNLDTDPILMNQSHNDSNNGLDLCKKLSKMGISCDPVDFGFRTSLHGRTYSWSEQNVSGASPMNDSSARQSFLQNTSHGVSHEDHVILMAKDQVGSKVLQKLLEEGTFLDIKVIFFEIINHVVELSVDPFGNYLVQKLLHVCDEEMRTSIMTVLTSNPMDLIEISCNNYGTRVVQKMIETVKTKQQIAMVKLGLEPGRLALVTDLKGNHVIQTCLKSLGPNHNKFVLEAVTKYCFAIASDQYGCCVVQCCISNSVGAQRERLIDEISRNSLYLSQDPYGNFVVQFLIEKNVSSAKLLKQLSRS